MVRRVYIYGFNKLHEIVDVKHDVDHRADDYQYRGSQDLRH